MRGLSLQEAMMQVAQGLDNTSLQPFASKKSDNTKYRKASMSELEAFIALDELLAGLHKEFADTKARAQEVIVKHGLDDPMALIAADLEDSAWCRMQTRYLELRTQRTLMERAQAMMRDVEREEERKKKEEENKKHASFLHHVWIIENYKKNKPMPSYVLWWAFVLYMGWLERQQERNALPLHQRCAA